MILLYHDYVAKHSGAPVYVNRITKNYVEVVCDDARDRWMRKAAFLRYCCHSPTCRTCSKDV